MCGLLPTFSWGGGVEDVGVTVDVSVRMTVHVMHHMLLPASVGLCCLTAQMPCFYKIPNFAAAATQCHSAGTCSIQSSTAAPAAPLLLLLPDA